MRILVADSYLPVSGVARRAPARDDRPPGVAGVHRRDHAEPSVRHRLGTVRFHRRTGRRAGIAGEHSSAR